MKNIIINKLQKDSLGLVLTKHTPKGFQNIKPKDDRYATLSWGMFDEIHQTKSIEQYGNTLFNNKTGKITKFVASDTLYNKYLIDAAVFAWQVNLLASKMPDWSPYVAFADNPIYFVDPGGNIIKVSEAKEGAINKYKTMVSNSFAGKVEAKINEQGIVTFHQIPDTQLTDNEKMALQNLYNAETSEYIADMTLTFDDDKITTADFYKNTIDVSDINSYGNNDQNGYTSKNVLVHETIEQIQKAKWESILKFKIKVPGDDPDRYYFDVCHSDAIDAESSCSTITRDKPNDKSNRRGLTWIKDDGSVEITEWGVLKNTKKTVQITTIYDSKKNNPKSTIEIKKYKENKN